MKFPKKRNGIGVTPKWSRHYAEKGSVLCRNEVSFYAEMESVLRRNYDLFSVLLRNLNDDCQTKNHTKY